MIFGTESIRRWCSMRNGDINLSDSVSKGDPSLGDFVTCPVLHDDGGFVSPLLPDMMSAVKDGDLNTSS